MSDRLGAEFLFKDDHCSTPPLEKEPLMPIRVQVCKQIPHNSPLIKGSYGGFLKLYSWNEGSRFERELVSFKLNAPGLR